MNKTCNRSRYQQCQARCLLLLLVVVLSFTTASAVRRERTIGSWRPVHYNVNVTLNDQLTEIVSARVGLELVITKPTSLVDLDFGDLTTNSVQVESRDVPFIHKDGLLQVKPTQPFKPGQLTLTITYHGKPKDGLILTRDKDGHPSAVGDNWPNRLHHWIPSLDHPSAKATITFNVTASTDDLVIANGKLDQVKPAGIGARTWTYSETVPIPPYCMIIVVGNFAKLPPLVPSSITPLSYYVPQSDSPHAQTGFAPAAPALEMFSEIIAPYPYEKLALIVGATRFGGMENSSAILFTQTLFNPNPAAKISPTFGISKGNVSLIAHEIAHQWFGDSVTESTWSDLWLSEGFATYFAGLFIRKYEGEDAFRDYMQQAAEASFAYEKKNLIPIFDRDTENLFQLLNANNYQKGAWVLHMLRLKLGDEIFFRGVRNYYERHKSSTASTEDFRAALEQASGKSLREFFARWIYDSGHPRYELIWNWDAKKKGVQIRLKQLQAGNAFTDPVELLLVGASESRSITVSPDRKEIVHFANLREAPKRIELDPNGMLLKEVVR